MFIFIEYTFIGNYKIRMKGFTMIKKIACILLTACVAVTYTGCTVKTPSAGIQNTSSLQTDISVDTPAENQTAKLEAEKMFSDSDRNAQYTGGYEIVLSDSKIESSCDTLLISGSTVTVKSAGTYIISGSLSDGQIIVDAGTEDKVRLVLSGAEIANDSSAPVYVRQADKVFITLAEGSKNTLSMTGQYQAIDENNIDSVIFSKDDLTINGTGELEISAESGHGIVSKDELTICSASLTVTAPSHAIAGKDSVKAADCTLNLNSGKDGIHAENADDVSLGFVYIEDGTLNITSDGDGISAAAIAQIQSGNFNIVSAGGAENASEKQNTDDFFRGADRMAAASYSESTDTVSCKGIKSDTGIVINGGSFIIDSADDALHSNGNIELNGGEFNISTGDDALHADNNVTVNSAEIDIAESYEGIEGLTIDINGGDISVVSSDDGLNAAGGNDGSGFGGGMQAMETDSDAYIRITGGVLYINAQGDGVDSNGALYVSGGKTYVDGPENSGNGALDYNGTAEITGGVFVAAGAMGMAQNFGSQSTQGAMLIGISGNGGDEIVLSDSDSNVILRYTPSKSYGSILISCKEIEAGKTYTLSSDGSTQTVVMTELLYQGGVNNGAGMNGGGRHNRMP